MKVRYPKIYLIKVDNVLNVLKIFLVLTALFFFPFSTFSETYVSGTINQNTTWILANSPYIVTGDIRVGYRSGSTSSYGTLTIEPGVEVRFNSGIGLQIGYNDDPGPQYGALLVRGTSDNPIIFTSSSTSPTPGIWKKIYFTDYTRDDATLLENCISEYGGQSRSANISLYCAVPTLRN